jgi:hypothetical protein
MHVRSLLAVAIAALLAVPAAVHAKTPVRSAPASKQLSVAGWLGYEMGDLDGIQLRVDGEMPYQKLTPQIALSFVGSVGFSHLTVSEFGFDFTANILKVVPAARFTLPVSPQLSVYGDAGLGLYYASLSSELPIVGKVSDSSVGFMLRLEAGGFYQVNPRAKVGGMLTLDPMFGDVDDATFAIFAGLTYQL